MSYWCDDRHLQIEQRRLDAEQSRLTLDDMLPPKPPPDPRIAEREAADRAREEEYQRRESLSMYWRINEADATDDVKEILHMMAEHMGLE